MQVCLQLLHRGKVEGALWTDAPALAAGLHVIAVSIERGEAKRATAADMTRQSTTRLGALVTQQFPQRVEQLVAAKHTAED